MKKFLFFAICSTMLMGSAAQALRFGPIPTVKIPEKPLVKFLPSQNESLEKAVKVHNLMTKMPVLQTMAEQQRKLRSQTKEMQKFFDDLMKCNEKRLGRFKNPSEVLGKLRKAYKERTANLETDSSYNEDSVVPRSLAEKNKLISQKRDIEEELLIDVFKNGKKWGGDAINKKNTTVPENLKTQLVGTGLEELSLAEDGTVNAKMADIDFEQTFKKMQEQFVRELDAVGLQFPEFEATRSSDIYQVKQALQDLKTQYLEEAKEYIEKLDAQDAAYPEAVARRAARSKNKKVVVQKVQEEFPELSGDMKQFDQQTPQQRQRVLVTALEKDKEGTVYLTETNAPEIDQKMAESAANKDMVKKFQTLTEGLAEEMNASFPSQKDLNFDMCSAG